MNILSTFSYAILLLFVIKRVAVSGFCLRDMVRVTHARNTWFSVCFHGRLVKHLFSEYRDRSFFMREGGLVGFGKHHVKIT